MRGANAGPSRPSSDPDTIAQRATPAGEGGLAVVRLSGPLSRRIVEAVFRPTSGPSSTAWRHATHGHLVCPETGRAIDEVVVTLFAEGSSFTGEESAEIGCHAGAANVARVLDLLFAHGARPAEPGEFSKRAFLNGRLDLAQAEAICDLVRSRSDAAAQAALRQLQGRLSDRVRAIREALMDLLAEIEVTIDFPDDDLLPVTTDRAIDGAESRAREVDELLSRAALGRAVREGVVVAIVGRPNVGKSSLLNALLGRDRAIVTTVPGTTRDTLEEQVVLGGIPFRLIDTAGLRVVADEVEAQGVDRAAQAAVASDLCLVMFDGSAELTEEDEEVIARIREATAGRIGVISKADLPQLIDESRIAPSLDCKRWVHTSTIEPGGMAQIEEAMVALVADEGVSADGELLTNARHIDLLRQARDELTKAADSCRRGLPIDVTSVGLRAAAERLGEITGDVYVPELVDRIFSTFCLGK